MQLHDPRIIFDTKSKYEIIIIIIIKIIIIIIKIKIIKINYLTNLTYRRPGSD